MSRKQALLLGCAVLAFMVVLVAAAGGVFLWYASSDPKGVAVSIESPITVGVGEEFTVSVVVENQRTRPFPLTDIDISNEYLEHFLVLETDPPANSSMNVPLDDTRSFSFDTDVPPGQTMRFDFTLRATAEGVYRGDVDVCEGMRYLSALLQTEVRGDR